MASDHCGQDAYAHLEEMKVPGCELGCTDCPLKSLKRIGSKGDPKAEFVIVGESPGANELAQGIPFVGMSGEMLAKALLPHGVEAFVTNAISCMPPGGDDKSTILPSMTRSCNGRLMKELDEHPRRVILALGNAALWSVTGNYNLKITQERGKIFQSPLASEGVVAAVHPAFLMRGGGSFRKWQEDINLAISLLKGEHLRKYVEGTPIIIETEEQAQSLIDGIYSAGIAAADIETTGLDRYQDKIRSICVNITPEIGYIIEPHMFYLFREVLASTSVKWIWHNGKFDVSFLEVEGIQARVDEDTMLLNYTLDETRGIHDLDTVASDVLGAPSHKHEIDTWVKGKGGSYARIPKANLYAYQAKDTSKTLQIYYVLRKKVAANENDEKLYTQTLIPASTLLCKIENRGFMVDYDRWDENRVRLEKKVEDLRKNICTLGASATSNLNYSINPNSPAQVAALFYDIFKLRDPSRKRSTAAKFMDKLPRVPVVEAMEDYRVAAKALSTYIYGLAENVSSDDACHSTYLLHGTATGRLASRDPNLQNIPRDPLLRGMFVSRDGFILIDGDASQAELRSLAELSQDPDLLAIFNSTDRSLHKEVAVQIWGPNYSEEDYVRAKAVNFGIVYGRTAYSLAKEFDISTKEAERWIAGWFARFPVAAKFIQKCRSAAQRRQTLVTNFGRKKRPGLVTTENLNNTQNEYANFPHQATASDLTLHVAMHIYPEVTKLGAYIVNLVHDSIIIETPDVEHIRVEVKRLIVEGFAEMARKWGLTSVPFKADCKESYRWGNKLEVKAAA